MRFKEFEGEWEYIKLSELLYEAKKRNEDLKYGKNDVLSVSGEFGIVNQIEHLGRSYAGESVHNYHIVETEDIVYTKSPLKSNPFGIIKINKGNAGIVSTLYAVYKVKSNNAYGLWIDSYFSLDANTNRYLRPLVKKGAKNDMKINNAYVLHDKIFIPSLAEQGKIASFISLIDDRIQIQIKIIQRLETLMQGLIEQLFKQQIRFKDNNGNNFPDWEKKMLGETCEVNPKVSTLPNSFFYIDLESVVSGALWKVNKILKDDAPSRAQRFLRKNDILFQTVRPYQKNNFYFDREGEYVASTGYTQLRTKQNSRFIYFYLHFQKFVDTVIERCTGTSYPAINSTDLSNIFIERPNLSEQERISNILSSIDGKIEAEKKILEQYRNQKNYLLQNMFI